MNTHTVNTSSGNLAMRSAPQVAEATWLANIPRGAGVELLSDDDGQLFGHLRYGEKLINICAC